MENILNIGFTACYIRDYNSTHVINIPFSVANEWVQHAVPNIESGISDFTFSEIVSPDQWLNKLFVIVGFEHDKWIALYNHDGRFSIHLI